MLCLCCCFALLLASKFVYIHYFDDGASRNTLSSAVANRAMWLFKLIMLSETEH